jgi:hypothetical protein
MALAKRSFKPQRLASVSYAVIARLRSSVSTQGRCIREIEGTWSGMRSLLKIGLAAGFAASNAASTSPRTRASFGYDAIGLQVGE